jgi:tRNA(adenine34) deaminase
MVDDGDAREGFMRMAIQEAEASLREGNHGFGAVIVRDSQVLTATHDTDETDGDPTAHAELKAIRGAAASIGKDLSSCMLICTHEPCPMCAGAIVWSKLKRIAYGYGIADALVQGRERIALSCEEVFAQSPGRIDVQKGLLRAQCAVLYNKDVRKEVGRLRNASEERLREYNEESAGKRVSWYQGEGRLLAMDEPSTLERAYRLILEKLGIEEIDAPVSTHDGRRIVFQSRNFCTTLEACRILQLDTRRICRLYNEEATDRLVKQVDPNLRFTRNYQKLRPSVASCEEIIEYT